MAEKQKKSPWRDAPGIGPTVNREIKGDKGGAPVDWPKSQTQLIDTDMQASKTPPMAGESKHDKSGGVSTTRRRKSQARFGG